MKIWTGSDLHVEFEEHKDLSIDYGDADVAVLAGDIGAGVGGIEWAASVFDIPVIYVAGNHEYYYQQLHEHTENMRECAKSLGIHYLECNSVEIQGVRFSGCTLWTDYAVNEDVDEAMAFAKGVMADHRLIKNLNRGFMPSDAAYIHRCSVEWLEKEARGSRVVVTHHCPSLTGLGSRHDRNEFTPAFISDLDELMSRLNPELWIFGHTHDSVDVVHASGTRLVSNQLGYPFEPNSEVGWIPGKIVELGE